MDAKGRPGGIGDFRAMLVLRDWTIMETENASVDQIVGSVVSVRSRIQVRLWGYWSF